MTQRTAAHRRQLLLALAGAAAGSLPRLGAQTLPTPALGAAGSEARLVVVFLRGAYDGLSALVPYGDPHYYSLRPTIAIPAPDGSAQTALALDRSFGLHPALAPLMPLWQSGVLGVLPAAGSPDPTRSHFEAQHHWEVGIPGRNSDAAGWMNTLAGMQPGNEDREARVLGVGEANPLILAGTAAVQRVPRGVAATRQGALGDDKTRQAMLQLYAGQDGLAQAFRAGAQSRMQTAQTLAGAMADQPMMASAEMNAANNGAGTVQGLRLDARHLATLMRQNPRLRLGFLSAGGWDTHANQGAVSGPLAQNLASLASTLVELRQAFSRPDDVVVVLSEFGRTSAENGSRGTDHGHGNALWLLGNRVNGGRWHGQWAGLAPGNLHEGRDLPVLHDFRSVLAQVLRATAGLGSSQLERLFPGFAWDASLDGLMRS